MQVYARGVHLVYCLTDLSSDQAYSKQVEHNFLWCFTIPKMTDTDHLPVAGESCRESG